MHTSLLVFLSAFLNSSVQADPQTDCTQFWTAITKANTQFETQKNTKFAKPLIDLLPSDKKQAPSDCPAQIQAIDSLEKNKAFRKSLMSRGKDAGFEVSFRMMHIADGAFAEELNADLANTIPKFPGKFLKYLKAEKGDVYCPKDLVRAVGSVSLSSKALAGKLKARARSLQKVTTDDLQDLKSDCLKQLSATEP